MSHNTQEYIKMVLLNRTPDNTNKSLERKWEQTHTDTHSYNKQMNYSQGKLLFYAKTDNFQPHLQCTQCWLVPSCKCSTVCSSAVPIQSVWCRIKGDTVKCCLPLPDMTDDLLALLCHHSPSKVANR